MTELPNTPNYYDWLQDLTHNSVLDRLMKEYYADSDSVFTARVNGKEYSYSIGTHPRLLHPYFSIEGVKYDDSLEEYIEHDEELIQHTKNQTTFNKIGEIDASEEDVKEHLWNGDSYIVNHTTIDQTDNSIEFTLTDSDFFTTVTQNQKLVVELMEAILDDHFVGSNQIISDDVFVNELPIRSRYFDSVVNRVKNSHDFKQGMGGTYVTIIESGGDYYLITGTRSSDVYVWPDAYTVFPAGLIQPTDISTGDIVRDHLLDEYAEEFFGLSDPTLASRSVKSLNQLLDSDDAEFHITGAGMELVYGNFQLSGLLIITYNDYIEFIEEHSEKSFQHQDISLIKLDELDDVIENFAHPFNITPTSGFSLLNGLNYLDEYTDIEQPVDVEIKQYVPEHPPRLETDLNGNIDLDVDW